MAKITDLPVADAITGDEYLPIVQGGATRRSTMAALRALIVPYLQQWYKGDTGPQGPAGNVAATLAVLKAAPTGNGTMIAAYDRSGATMTWTEGDFTALAALRPADYVKSDSAPLTAGAWVRLQAASIAATGNVSLQQALDTKPSAAQLIALADPRAITGATALTGADLNRRIVCGTADADYMVNFPPVGAGDEGKATVLVVIDRSTRVVVSLQAAAGSGLNVDGAARREMIAGERALFVYDGAVGWRRLDYVPNPLLGILRATTATALTIGSFTSVPVPGTGRQLMEQDLSALWKPDTGYFTAPRAGTYTFVIALWLIVNGGPARVDIGAYVGTAPGGVPGDADFVRSMSDAADYQRQTVTLTFSMNAGEKLFPAVRVYGPATAATVSAGVVASTITVTEHPR